MQVPSILQAASLTRLLQGIALGAAATMVIGFYWGGWTLASTAKQMAENHANTAVVAVLAPICVDKFQQQEDAAAKLVEFKKIISWNQASFVAAHGWATMPGAGAPKTLAVARACAEMLGRLRG
jgi:ABC-type nitrate/sulfonate/bicarbonate transport system permease component